MHDRWGAAGLPLDFQHRAEGAILVVPPAPKGYGKTPGSAPPVVVAWRSFSVRLPRFRRKNSKLKLRLVIVVMMFTI